MVGSDERERELRDDQVAVEHGIAEQGDGCTRDIVDHEASAAPCGGPLERRLGIGGERRRGGCGVVTRRDRDCDAK